MILSLSGSGLFLYSLFFSIPLLGFPWDLGETEITVLNILLGPHPYSDIFNFFFTLVIFFGIVSFCIGLIIRLLSRS